MPSSMKQLQQKQWEKNSLSSAFVIMFKMWKEGCSCSSKRLLVAFCKSSSLPCPESGSGWINVERVEKRNKSIFQDWVVLGGLVKGSRVSVHELPYSW